MTVNGSSVFCAVPVAEERRRALPSILHVVCLRKSLILRGEDRGNMRVRVVIAEIVRVERSLGRDPIRITKTYRPCTLAKLRSAV